MEGSLAILTWITPKKSLRLKCRKTWPPNSKDRVCQALRHGPPCLWACCNLVHSYIKPCPLVTNAKNSWSRQGSTLPLVRRLLDRFPASHVNLALQYCWDFSFTSATRAGKNNSIRSAALQHLQLEIFRQCWSRTPRQIKLKTGAPQQHILKKTAQFWGPILSHENVHHEMQQTVLQFISEPKGHRNIKQKEESK